MSIWLQILIRSQEKREPCNCIGGLSCWRKGKRRRGRGDYLASSPVKQGQVTLILPDSVSHFLPRTIILSGETTSKWMVECEILD
ncbi:hypothetical protein ACN38_g1265 [Penicillium nordicum]|uniref:Uncharacterized protein n=1 Tax=Penicillium nordicum TaxID=229535 RepID=A0A0M9WK03_9EURO|nr:hypothetical protein ACN38_g1265 [Penicillium nordicum]